MSKSGSRMARHTKVRMVQKVRPVLLIKNDFDPIVA